MTEDQNYYFSRFLNFAGWIFSNTLDKSDMISLYGAKKLLKVSPFIYKNMTAYLSENNAANAIFLAINLAVVAYQYIYSSWFLYLITTFSGIKKLYKVILQNPILGIFFYFSFYFKLLGETDKEKFNKVALAFNLPIHEDFIGSTFLSQSMTNISEKLSGEDVTGYKKKKKKTAHKIISEQIVSAKIEGLPMTIGKLLHHVVTKENDTLQEIKNPAVYVDSRTIETQRDFDEFAEFVTTHKREIQKQIKKEVGSKNKRAKKLRLQQIVEKKNPDGDVVCLDMCEPRLETAVGCYCEGECGPTIFLAGASWCYVDPNKCKRGKYLPKHLGKAWDRCDPTKVTTPKCFTGMHYSDCQVKRR